MQEKLTQIMSFIKRLKFDILVLAAIFSLMFFIPPSVIPDSQNSSGGTIIKFNFLYLFITKFLLVSAGIIHAHITRKILFSYIDFEKENSTTNNIMIIALYIVIIFAWSRGG